MTAVSFREPGSGLLMLLGKWYVLHDTGYPFTNEGFDSAEAAVDWWHKVGNAEHELNDLFQIDVPVFLGANVGWDLSSLKLVLVFRADDLFEFWKYQDPTYDLEINYE